MSSDDHNPDQHAEFVHLLTTHQDSLRAFIISRMPGSSEVADVLQEVNASLWKKRRNFEIGTNFIAWSFTLANFEILTHWRKMRRDQISIKNEDLLERLTPRVEELLPEHLRERLDALESCMKKLPPEQRELITQRYEKGVSMEDYSKSVGRTANALRVGLFRARNNLRECIQLRLNTPQAST